MSAIIPLPLVPDRPDRDQAAQRVLDAVSGNPKLPVEAGAIAEATGMTAAQVTETLADPEFRRQIQERFRPQLVIALLRGCATMDQLVQSKKQPAMTRVRAFQALNETLRSMGVATLPPGQPPGKGLQAAFEKLEAMKRAQHGRTPSPR